MALLLMAVVVVAMIMAAGATYPPLPPKQTAYQRSVTAASAARAAKASAAALPATLAALDAPAFRSALRSCCPSVAALPAVQLLQQLHDEVQLAEVTHNFPASHVAPIVRTINQMDLDLDMVESQDFFLNQWQIAYFYPNRTNPDETVRWLAPADCAERNIFGFRDFSGCTPSSWPTIRFPQSAAQAGERLVYTAMNQFKLDAGVSAFGGIGVVFNTSDIRDMVMLSPMDSGDYTLECTNCTIDFCSQAMLRHNASRCNHPYNYCRWKDGACTGGMPGTSSWANCSGFSGLGTFDHLTHLILAQATWHRTSPPVQSLQFLFSRVFGDYFSESYNPFNSQYSEAYWEANLAGTAIYPTAGGHGVRFILGDFPALFGTARGQQLRRWCTKQGWALVWAMGNGGENNPGGSPAVVRANLRLLDSNLGIQMTNLSASLRATAATAYRHSWAAVRTAREPTSEPINATIVQRWWAQLEARLGVAGSDAYRLEPLRHGRCALPHSCVGLNRAGNCVCYS